MTRSHMMASTSPRSHRPLSTWCAISAESNGSELLECLQEETPEGLLEMLRVPGLGPARIRLIHDGLHIETLQELEQAAADGRLAALPRFGDRTAERIALGIAALREAGRVCAVATRARGGRASA